MSTLFTAMLLLFSPVWMVSIKPADADTTVCDTQTSLVSPYRTLEPVPTWSITAQICGTASSSGSFLSVTHTVLSGIDYPERWEPDWEVSVEYRLYGLKNITQGYYQHYIAGPNQLPQTTYNNNSGQVDFALTYVTISLIDHCPSPTLPCEPEEQHTVQSIVFVGFKESLEVDWADGDNSGVVDNPDMNSLQSVYDQNDAYWDLNKNGVVDVTDASVLAIHFDKSWLLQPYPGQAAPGLNLSTKTLQTAKWQTSCPILPVLHRIYLNCA